MKYVCLVYLVEKDMNAMTKQGVGCLRRREPGVR